MSARAPVNPRKLLTWLGLGFGLAALALQFTLSMQTMLGSGRDLFGSLGHFWSYYTILTNLVLVLIYLSEVLPARWLALFRNQLVRATMAGNMALVGLYVYFVLRHLAVFEGLDLLADNMLHYLCPVLYILWWLVTQPHGGLRWSKLPLMLVPTLVYFVYAMLRGLWVLEYPYPILNAIKLGYPQVLLNAVYMIVGLSVLMAIVIALDGLLGRKSRTAA